MNSSGCGCCSSSSSSTCIYGNGSYFYEVIDKVSTSILKLTCRLVFSLCFV